MITWRKQIKLGRHRLLQPISFSSTMRREHMQFFAACQARCGLTRRLLGVRSWFIQIPVTTSRMPACEASSFEVGTEATASLS